MLDGMTDDLPWKKSFMKTFFRDLNARAGTSFSIDDAGALGELISAYKRSGDDKIAHAFIHLASHPMPNRQLHETMGNGEVIRSVLGALAVMVTSDVGAQPVAPPVRRTSPAVTAPLVREPRYTPRTPPPKRKRSVVKPAPALIPEPVVPDVPITAENWYHFAACQGEDIDLFYPASQTKAAAKAAKDICARCIVKSHCLDEALRRHEQGIWGGTTDKERDQMKRRAALPR